jgi:hypothetical protein
LQNQPTDQYPFYREAMRRLYDVYGETSAGTEPAASPCVGKMVMATVLGLSAL